MEEIRFPPYYNLHVERELRRIGVDLEQLGGLASENDLIPEEFLRWLRTIPDGTGHEQFMRLLSRPANSDAPEAPGVAAYTDPEIDEQLSFHRELNRVVPRESIRREQSDPNAGFGFDMPHGRRHALAVLRTLPDGAGPRAFVTALYAAPASLADRSDEPAG